MALADTFLEQVKLSGKPSGDKHTDGNGMYLLVNVGTEGILTSLSPTSRPLPGASEERRVCATQA